MGLFYSPSLNAFYDEAIHGPRQVEVVPHAGERAQGRGRARLADSPTTLIPDDALAISAEEHDELLTAQAAGKSIIARGKKAVVVEPLPTDPATALAIVRSRRDTLLAETDKVVSLPDYPVTPEQRQEVLDYRAALREVPAQLDRSDPLTTVRYPDPPAFLRDDRFEGGSNQEL